MYWFKIKLAKRYLCAFEFKTERHDVKSEYGGENLQYTTDHEWVLIDGNEANESIMIMPKMLLVM